MKALTMAALLGAVTVDVPPPTTARKVRPASPDAKHGKVRNVEKTEKFCRVCKVMHPVSEFYVTGKTKKGLNKYAAFCITVYRQKSRDRYQERKKEQCSEK